MNSLLTKQRIRKRQYDPLYLKTFPKRKKKISAGFRQRQFREKNVIQKSLFILKSPLFISSILFIGFIVLIISLSGKIKSPESLHAEATNDGVYTLEMAAMTELEENRTIEITFSDDTESAATTDQDGNYTESAIVEAVIDETSPLENLLQGAVAEASATIFEPEPVPSELTLGSDEGFGAGKPAVDRKNEVFHIVKRGETLSEIAKLYHIDVDKIAIYNQILDTNSIRYGMELKIPSYAKEATMAPKTVLTDVTLTTVNNIQEFTSILPDPTLHITAEKYFNGTSVTASLSIADTKNITYKRFYWDFGNGERAYYRNATVTYTNPGTYTASLVVKDSYGKSYRSNEVFIDVPYPGSYKDDSHEFITLNNVGETFDIHGYITNVYGYPDFERLFVLDASEFGKTYTYRALEAGFFDLTIQVNEHEENVYLFVSPQESVHSENADLLWYRTQGRTGTVSNCGPSTVSMGIAWAHSDYVPVINIRQQIGWRDQKQGATSFTEIAQALNTYNVNAKIKHIRSVSDIFPIIDNGKLAIILFNTGGISRSDDPTHDLYGRYYEDVVGHYVIVKGYTTDGKYLIVNDPLPADWYKNSVRYGDNISMLGRNRYYSVDELSKALTSWSIVEITR